MTWGNPLSLWRTAMGGRRDTFPVGCAWSDKMCFISSSRQSDRNEARYQTREGIYDKGAGLDTVLMSWGHDEYLHNVVKDYLPTEALYMIRYQSFYPAHRDGEYDYLMNGEGPGRCLNGAGFQSLRPLHQEQ